MPRSKGFLSSTTYNQLLTKTLPGIEAMWQEMGLVEALHYVVGKRPPEHWPKPYAPPRKYENIITFCNGRCIELLSMDRPDLARGGSYSDGSVDEAALVPREHVATVLLPSLRGFRHKFTSDLYGGMCYYTSIPWKPSGYWILEYEERAKANPERYLFSEANAYDNIDVLGLQYILNLEAELGYLVFLVEVMNQRVRKVKDAFYHRFDADLHSYTVKYLYGEGERGIITNGMADPHYNPDQALDFTFDFSGWFNCATAWQDGRVDKRPAAFCLHQFHVKQEEGKVGELVDKICTHYAKHQRKVARIYGEPRGHDKKPDTIDTIYDQVTKRFRTNGWVVEVCVKPGQVKAHKERNTYMNDVLSESNPQLPVIRFNDATCKDVIIAMQVTEVNERYEKNKTKEKDRHFPQEHAPHYTDGVDYYMTQKHGWRTRSRGTRMPLNASVR
jgi:hypothetical protein